MVSEHGHVTLSEDRDVEIAIRRERHAIRALPAQWPIGPDHVPEKGTGTGDRPGMPFVAVDIPGERFVHVEPMIQAECNAVREFDARVEFLDLAGCHIDSVDSAVVLDSHIVRADLIVGSELVNEYA